MKTKRFRSCDEYFTFYNKNKDKINLIRVRSTKLYIIIDYEVL